MASLLAAHIRSREGADLVLCGRRASDDDQGVVPAMIAENLGAPVVTVARSVESTGSDPASVRVVRVTPEGDEIVEVDCPAVITVSSELGDPRYPTMPMKMAARKVDPTAVTPQDLALDDAGLAPRVRLSRQYVPVVESDCEMIEGDGPAEWADRLVERLIEERVLKGGA
ncbi:MAG: hypothetical protein M5U19_20950 [Microthrixaceae bacterium]|nr:hypothetical protein [Microthrixaceae bacterium]